MKQYNWEEFYEKYLDWSERTTANNVKNLTGVGSVQEVAKVLLDLSDYPKAANQLLQMAIDAKLALPFTDLVELYDCCNADLLSHAVEFCELDDRDSESITDVLCMVEKGPLFDAIMNKALSCGVRFREDDFLSLSWELEEHPETANRLLREAVDKEISFDAWELSDLPDYVDKNLIREAMKHASVEDLDAEMIQSLMDDYSDDREMLQTLIAKAYRAKKRAKLSDLLWLDGECDTGYFIRMVELSEVDDVDALAGVVRDYSWNQKAVEILKEKILKEKIAFSGEQLANLEGAFDDAVMEKIVWQSAGRLEYEDIDAMAGFVPDALLVEICKKRNLGLPESVIDEEALKEELEAEEYEEKMYRRGAGIRGFVCGLINLDPVTLQPGPNRWERRKRARGCSGDCKNCPPHYGYRYGRWYYGRCHQHGCEFGGNIGNGAYD